MFYKKFILVLFLCFNLVSCVAAEENKVLNTLNFDDLVELSKTEKMQESLQKKLDYVLNTPIISNVNLNEKKVVNNDPIIGNFVRVGTWNIERGLHIDLIKMIFENPDEFYKKIKGKNLKEIQKEAEILRNIDILMIDEADIGMPRTHYKNIPEELAKTLHFNYAYAPEFVEVDPSHLGLQKYEWSEEKFLFPDEEYTVDKKKYKGLHGNAILSRYPLKNVRIIRLPNEYDWFNDEKDKVVEIEYLRRKAADFIFREAVFREIRRGSRIALVAEVEVPGMSEPLTVISVHLENRTLPQARYKQMSFLLDKIKDINTPLVMGGDLNTTTKDGRPTTIKRELKKRLTNPDFLARQTVYVFLPQALLVSAGQITTDFVRKYNNPTVFNIPIISPNKERKLFSSVKKIKFADGGNFDAKGQKYRSINGHDGVFSDTNQRSNFKGFVPTFVFDRDWYVGRFKIDWLFVKPCACKYHDSDKLKIFSPFYGRTLYNLNYSISPEISDHAPITVDLPIDPPGKKEVKKRKKELKLQTKDSQEKRI